NMEDFIKSIDELDTAIGLISQSSETVDKNTLPPLLEAITGKTQLIRKRIAELDARIEKTVLEWEDLKKNEIGLTVLENQIRKSLRPE
ncbi:MAG: response regulator, partial [Treponema sp.]|nr:response regulator [Treponema sp.]